MLSVSVYLAASPLADHPLAERPQELLDDEIKQPTAQLEHSKALRAGIAAPQPQAAPLRRLL